MRYAPFLNTNGIEYLRRDYEDLLKEYEDLRKEYEDLRRPFAMTTRDQWGDVWTFPIERNRKHPAQKPIAMIEQIVAASSREGSVVCDPFMGSGTTGVAAIRKGREFAGIEIDPAHFETAKRRIRDELRKMEFLEPKASGERQASLFAGAH